MWRSTPVTNESGNVTPMSLLKLTSDELSMKYNCSQRHSRNSFMTVVILYAAHFLLRSVSIWAVVIKKWLICLCQWVGVLFEVTLPLSCVLCWFSLNSPNRIGAHIWKELMLGCYTLISVVVSSVLGTYLSCFWYVMSNPARGLWSKEKKLASANAGR